MGQGEIPQSEGRLPWVYNNRLGGTHQILKQWMGLNPPSADWKGFSPLFFAQGCTLLLEPGVAAIILCRPGGFTLPLWKGDKSSSYLHSSSQISRWLSTRICKMCPSTSYYWWQGWLAAMSQSEKSEDEVRQWGNHDSQSPRLCHGSCWRTASHPEGRTLTTTRLQMGQKGSGCSLSSYHHMTCPPLLRRLSLDRWQCGAVPEQMSRGWSLEWTWSSLCRPIWFSCFPWRKKRKNLPSETKNTLTYWLISMPKPVSSGSWLNPPICIQLDDDSNAMVILGDVIIFLWKSMTSLPWCQARLLWGKCFLWTRKVGGRKNPTS